MDQVSVHAIWLAQDDPKKNTAVLAAKRGNLKLHKKINSIPRKGVILEPLCGKVFGPEDHDLILTRGGAIVGLDCSWVHIESSVEQVMKRTRLQPRMLPLLLAANPAQALRSRSRVPSVTILPRGRVFMNRRVGVLPRLYSGQSFRKF